MRRTGAHHLIDDELMFGIATWRLHAIPFIIVGNTTGAESLVRIGFFTGSESTSSVLTRAAESGPTLVCRPMAEPLASSTERVYRGVLAGRALWIVARKQSLHSRTGRRRSMPDSDGDLSDLFEALDQLMRPRT